MGWVQRSELNVFQGLGIFQRDNELLLKISHNSKEKKGSRLWPLDTIIISGVTTTLPWVLTECRVSHWCYFTRSHSAHREKTKPLLWKAWSSLFAFVPIAKLRTSNEMQMNQVELRLKCSALPRPCIGRAIAECSDSSFSNFKEPAMLSAGLCPLLFPSLGKRFSENVRPWPCTPVCGMLCISLHSLDCVELVLFICNAVLFHVSCGPAGSPQSLFWFAQAWACCLLSFCVAPRQYLQHGVARKCSNDHGVGSFSLPAHTHLLLPSARDASGTLTLHAEMLYCALDCGY